MCERSRSLEACWPPSQAPQLPSLRVEVGWRHSGHQPRWGYPVSPGGNSKSCESCPHPSCLLFLGAFNFLCKLCMFIVEKCEHTDRNTKVSDSHFYYWRDSLARWARFRYTSRRVSVHGQEVTGCLCVRPPAVFCGSSVVCASVGLALCLRAACLSICVSASGPARLPALCLPTSDGDLCAALHAPCTWWPCVLCN